MDDSMSSISLLINDIKNIEVLSQEEETILLKKAKNNDKEARDKLVTHNIRLVFKWAKKYGNNNSMLPDLIQEGTIGLFSAIDKY